MEDKAKPLPKSIRFDSEASRQIEELADIFDENPVRVIHRAISYLYTNREAAIDAEAAARKQRIQNKEK